MKPILLLSMVALYFVGVATIGTAFGFEAKFFAPVVLVLLMFAKGPAGVLRESIDVSAIASQLGDYYAVNRAKIWSMIRMGSQIKNFMSGVPKVTGFYSTISAGIGQIHQPWQPAFTEKGTITISPFVNEAKHVKADIKLEDLDKLYNGYLAFLVDGDEGKPRQGWSFVRYLMEQVIIPAMIEEIEIMMCVGEYAAPTPGTAGDYLESYDGIFTKVTSLVASSDLTPIVVGSTSNSNAVDKYTTFMDGIADKYKSKGGVILTSVAEQMKYVRNYRTINNGSGVQADKYTVTLDDHPNVQIVGLFGATGVQRKMFIPGNPKDTLIHLFNELNGPSKFETQGIYRDVVIMHDRHEGVGFNTLDGVHVSDLA